MNKQSLIRKNRLCASLLVALAFASGPSAYAAGSVYQQHNLVGNASGAADVTDPNLVNPWGVAFNPFGTVWVSDNGTSVSTSYDGTGAPSSTVVQIPTPSGATGGHPTGIVFNGSPLFVVNSNGTGTSTTGPSSLIFATEEGVIAAWSSTVDQTHAIKMVDNSSATGAVYKGLAMSSNSTGTGSQIYATDFHNNKIDVFDGTFNPVSLAAGAFTDPNLPAGFAPFGIQAINGSIYVTYAMQDSKQHDDVKGQGLGFVNVFDTSGLLIKRLVSQGNLNAPWGMALAPASFGDFGSRLLVGNFGDGTINAFDIATGASVGQLMGTNGSAITIDGLWALVFGNGFSSQPVNTLFFSAGPNNEQNGLYGRIDVQNSSTTTGGSTSQSSTSTGQNGFGASGSAQSSATTGTSFGTGK